MQTPNTDQSQAAVGLGSTASLGSVLRIEHGWLTIRTETGWLLWSRKCSDIDGIKGIDFHALLAEVEKQYAEWKVARESVSA